MLPGNGRIRHAVRAHTGTNPGEQQTMTENRLEQAILEFVSAPGYRPVKPKAIAKALGLSADDARDLKRTIKKLVKQNRLSYGANHLVRPARDVTPRGVTGVFRRMSAGYGFVRPETGRPLGRKPEDIYVSGKNAGDASTGDTVLVRVHRTQTPSGKPGPSGKIIRVLERDTHQFVGTYVERGGSGLVIVDGRVFQAPVGVGDPGARGAQPDDKVVVEMVRFPSHAHEGEAVVIDVLGPSGDPGVDTLSIIHEFRLPGDFEDEVLEEARQEAENFDESIADHRHDFTGETVITIDPEDARDFDDAISLVAQSQGHLRLGVHIADVTHFVRTGTALDQEARQRATSVYLPDRVIPMLPEVISNNLASLQPGRVRYCVSALMEFTPEGMLVDTQLVKAAVKSKRRFTYAEVDSYLASPSAWRGKLPGDVHALLGRMHQLAMTLRRRRVERGALELSMPEVKVQLDRHGRVIGAHLVEHTESHQIIEEFMLAANEAVANALEQKKLAFLRRVHASPDPRKLMALKEFVSDLGLQTEDLQSRFALQKLLASISGKPQQHAVNYAVLRSMQKAIYSPEEEGHYALASACYCHFTSPIRRYPDLSVHRLVAAITEDHRATQNVEALYELGAHCSQQEQRAEDAERELIKIKLLNYLSDHIGMEMDAVVTGVEAFGLFVQGIDLPAEGLIHVSSLADDLYHFDRAAHTLSGFRSGNQFRLGDALRVTVAHVDVLRRELDFRMVRRLEQPPRPRTTKAPKASQKGDRRSKKARLPTKKSAGPGQGRQKKTNSQARRRKR